MYTCSCSCGVIISSIRARPTGTRKKSDHCTAPYRSKNGTISSRYGRLSFVTVVFTWTDNPTSWASWSISMVRRKEPENPRKLSWIFSFGPSRLRAIRRIPASMTLLSRFFVTSAVELGVSDVRSPFSWLAYRMSCSRSRRIIGSPPVKTSIGLPNSAI